jgi:hypothetical protein
LQSLAGVALPHAEPTTTTTPPNTTTNPRAFMAPFYHMLELAMAMCTYVQMVTDEEIAALRKKPESINQLDKPETFSTYLFTPINYFLTGSAYPGKKHALAALLCGEKSVATQTLENGSFDVTSAKTVAKLATELAKVDLKKVKKKIEAADWDELRDSEEVDEECVLESSEDVPQEIIGEIEGLKKFLASAAKKKRGLAIFTA